MRYLIALLLLSSLAHAEGVVSVGIGKGALEGHGTPFERVVSVGYQKTWGDFFIRPQAGYFLDISGQGKSSTWVSALFGVRAVSSTGLEFHVAVGPAYLQNPDQILGGHFQFNLEGCIGVTDKNVFLGACGQHLSSAGIEQPNQGRDFFPMVQARLFL